MNKLICHLEKDFTKKAYYTSFDIVLDNNTVRFNSHNNDFTIIIEGASDKEELLKAFLELYSLLFLYEGYFPNIICITYNDEKVDFSNLAGKYKTNSYYKNLMFFVCPITKDTINQQKIDNLRKISKLALSSIQSIISDNYSSVLFIHKLILLLHAIDGIVIATDNLNDSYKLELKMKYNLNKKPGEYLVKTYILCKKVIFDVPVFYDLLKLVNVNEYNFLCVISDTRNWYSHFLQDNKKQFKLIDSTDIVIYFHILLCSIRFYLLDILGIEINKEYKDETFNILYDWINIIKNNKNIHLKSTRYRNNEIMNKIHNKFNNTM